MINKLFPLVKEIKSKNGELHFRRYKLLNFFNLFTVYFHIVYKSDSDYHLHNHPWNYVQIPLKGSYLEELENSKYNIVYPLKIKIRKATTYHKIKQMISTKAYSLFIVGKICNPIWSYKVGNKLINNTDYRILKRNGCFDN